MKSYKEVIFLAKEKRNKPDKNIQAEETVEFDISADVIHTTHTHTANKPKPKYTKK